jgi:hypothetical protein
MKTQKISIPIASVLLVIAITLSACQATELSETDIAPTVEILGPKNPYQAQNNRPAKTPEVRTDFWLEGISRLDTQGAVEVEVIPKEIRQMEGMLDFEVLLNTHSIDLSMDLAQLSILETDTGFSLTAAAWSGLPGGHHISGVLSFPAESDGLQALADASRIIITIRDIDAPERVFVWER